MKFRVYNIEVEIPEIMDEDSYEDVLDMLRKDIQKTKERKTLDVLNTFHDYVLEKFNRFERD